MTKCCGCATCDVVHCMGTNAARRDAVIRQACVWCCTWTHGVVDGLKRSCLVEAVNIVYKIMWMDYAVGDGIILCCSCKCVMTFQM